MTHPLEASLNEKREAACETLDSIEDQAWDLCSSIRDLRIHLGRIESIREKFTVS